MDQEQEKVVSFLRRPEAYRNLNVPDWRPDVPVKEIETHTAHVFLVGKTRAYKLQRQAHFPFLDLSTMAKRKTACDKEYTLNGRATPEMYLKVLAILPSGDSDGLMLRPAALGDPDPAAVDHVVEMVQFLQEDMLSALADRCELTPAIVDSLMDVVFAFHEDAEVFEDEAKGFESMHWIAEDNAKELTEFAENGVVPLDKVMELNAIGIQLAQEGQELLNARATRHRCVRMCHGDLHLKNIVMIDGEPRLFDCIAFNDSLAQTDVLYDLAFLFMDLCVRNLHPLANRAMNRYIAHTGDIQGLQLLPFFLLCRASIRAKVACVEYAGHDSTNAVEREKQKARALCYVEHALNFARPQQACGVAIGGLSGTGKSTVAAALSPQIGACLGAVVLRSDAIRKRLHNADIFKSLPQSAYSAEATEKTYSVLAQQCQAVLASGFCAIADATFTAETHRQRAWLRLPYEVRLARVQTRASSNAPDCSDVTPEKLASVAKDEPTLSAPWLEVDAAPPADDVAARLLQLLVSAGGRS